MLTSVSSQAHVRPRGSIVLVVLVVGVGWSLGAPDQALGQEVELRWQFQPGQELVYELTQVSDTETPTGTVTQTQVQTQRYTVLDVADDGTARLGITTDRLRVVAETPMGRQEFDSEDPAAGSAELAMLGGMVGMSFEMTLGSDGRVEEVSGLDQMVDEMVEQMAQENPGAAGQMREMMEGMFGEDAMESTMQQGVQPLPRDPVAPGGGWEFSLTQPLGFGSLRTEAVYTLREVVEDEGRSVARIDVEGSIGDFEPEEGHPMGGMLEVSDGDLTGEIHFDIEAGVLSWSEVVTTIRMEAMGQGMTTRTSQQMELKEIIQG